MIQVSSPQRPRAGTRNVGRGARILVATLLIVSALVTTLYVGLSLYISTQLAYVPQTSLYATPAKFGMQFRDVTFPSRVDQVQLKGWFIPGVLPNGKQTAQRTIIVVHGNRTNRADKDAGLLQLSVDFAQHGFAVLAFDMRGTGESPPEPLSLGYFEQRDVLGAVDFLQSGTPPYPELGRPRAIAGWGVFMGAASLLLATAQEPAIRTVVSDCAYADIAPILEREVPTRGHLPTFFTPGALRAIQALYGIDYYSVRPLDIVASIAPRPIYFIHGDQDGFIPHSNMTELAAAAQTAPNAHVQTWLVPGADHAKSFDVEGQTYVTNVVAFYTQALGPDTSAA